jgi:hypothetical protein
MGPERIFYGWVEWECSGCGKVIIVEVTVSEYPVGALNHADWVVKGGTLVKTPELQIEPD